MSEKIGFKTAFLLFREQVLEISSAIKDNIIKKVDLKLHDRPYVENLPVSWSVMTGGVSFSSSSHNPFLKSIASIPLGMRPHGSVAYSIEGTPFQIRVWMEVSKIPIGCTLSYGEVAKNIGCGSPRAVGQALNRNSLPLIIPCHRVVGRDGALTGFSEGVDVKAFLLEMEGVQLPAG